MKSVVKLQLCLDEVSEKEHDQTNNNEKMKMESELLCSYRRNKIAGCFCLGILYCLFRSERGLPNRGVFIFIDGPEW